MNQFFYFIISIVKRFRVRYELRHFRSLLGFCDKTAIVSVPNSCSCPQKIFLYENTNIYGGSDFIINPNGDDGKFIMKKNSGSSRNLVVITGNHQRKLGHFFKEMSSTHTDDIDKDVIVEEDVWIGANVTLLPGVVIGRGSTIGAGSICIKNVPPYAVVMGNPARVIGFNFTPEEIIEHEKVLYEESERLPLEFLQKNYEKYYINRIKDIKQFIKI